MRVECLSSEEDFMDWEPLSLSELESSLAKQLEECSEADRVFFRSAQIAPAKWILRPWGDEGDGFWAVAVCENRVL
jgi:hypothetical protein